MNRRLLFFVALFFSAISSNAQTALSAGELSITGFNSGITDKDGVSFVCWVPILSGTTIRFTFDAFNSSLSSTSANNWRHNGNTLTWTANAAVAAGTVIKIEQNGTASSPLTSALGTIVTSDASGVTIANNTFLFSNGSESLFAFQSVAVPSTVSLTATFSGTLLYGVGWQGGGVATGWLTTGSSSGSASYLPTDIAAYGLFFASSTRGAEYSGARTGQANFTLYKNLVNAGGGNWTLSTTGIDPMNTNAFITIPLQVSLSSFNVVKEENQAGLYWSTESEMDNAGFDIERSSDGKGYEVIGTVLTKAIHGNSNATLTYSFHDMRPLAGVNLYRLAQKDRSGKVTYSVARSVSFDQQNGFIIYPNPVQDQMTVQYSSDKDVSVTIRVTDVTGKVVLTKELKLQSGLNKASIDMSALNGGLYYATIMDQSGMICNAKIVKR